jgi:hypothetical protein
MSCTTVCPTPPIADWKRAVNTLVAFLIAAFSFWVASALNDMFKTMIETLIFKDGKVRKTDEVMRQEKKEKRKLVVSKVAYGFITLILGTLIVFGLSYALQS